jgi:CheY-like chemotaxis protein
MDRRGSRTRPTSHPAPKPPPALAAAAETPQAPRGATVFTPDERYQILSMIGRGGMGVVYKVHDRELDEVIALKVLRPASDKPGDYERFRHEVKVARRIHHPNVARLYDLVTFGGRPAITQEYIPGPPLTRVAAQGPVPAAGIRRFLTYMCSALDAAHRLGVVHRDLKPANILFDRALRPRIVDFGTASFVGVETPEDARYLVATPAYLAPEMVHDRLRVDQRADIYSLGVILFELATGRLPFRGRSAPDLITAHLEQEAPDPAGVHPGISAALAGTIRRCLRKDPAERYPSAGELLRDLDRGLRRELKPRDAVQASGGAPRGKVLVIDDDPDQREWLRIVLEGFGCQVAEASGGEQGAEAAVQERPQLILLDILMPRMDGRQTLRALKADARVSAVPVVMVTSLTDEEEDLLAKEQGAAGFLSKPVQKDVLALLVDRYLDEPPPEDGEPSYFGP